MNLFKHVKQSLYILDKEKNKLYWMLVLFVSSSLLDVIGIGLIAPYVALIIDPESFLQNDFYLAIASIGLPDEEIKLILTLGFFLIFVFFLKMLSSVYINKTILTFCLRKGSGLRSELMNIYQNMSYLDYIQRNSADYIYNIQQLAAQYSHTYLQSVLRLVSEGVVGLVILLLLAWSNVYALGLLLALLAGLVILYDRIFRLKTQEYGLLSNVHSTRMVKGVCEGIEGLKELRILGREEYFYNIVNHEASEFANANIKVGVISTIPRYLLELVLITFVVLLVFGSITFEYSTELLLPVLSMFAVAAMRLAPSANQIISGMTKIRYSYHSVSVLYKDIRRGRAEKDNLKIARDMVTPAEPSKFQYLQFKQVVFTYPNMKKSAINNLNFDLHAGESIGLIGKSGSGKTTTVDLLLGLLKPDSGEITFNKLPLMQNLSLWRSKVAYIPQNIFLIDDTLRRNIALESDGVVDKEKMMKAISQAKLIDLVEQLPMGLDTVLGEKGVRLSGGQRQRIALARAFYYDREILVMDEATSALDNETEKEIIEEIELLKGKKTLIVIAHRHSTIEHCDKILRLENGKVIDQGDYKELFKK